MEKLAVINGVDVELEVVDNAVYTTSLSVAEVFNKKPQKYYTQNK
ncbi:hypothetical protein ACWDW0_000937 [Campylobacter coli]